LKITVETNLKSVNYLDIHMDLNTGSHTPFRKPNDQPLYINVNSNHPESITKHIPTAIQKRISTLSSNKEICDESSKMYNDALHESGYPDTIKYHKENNDTNKPNRNRSRKTIWFNPPFSKAVKSSVGGTFLKLIDKHFPPGSKLHKIFNKNNVKVSYSCTQNISSIIKAHNTKIVKKPDETSKKCN
jgi:hypothetical protein